MKRIFTAFSALALAASALTGCDEERITYDGPSYVAFADTLSVYPVQQSCEPFGVDIAATRAVGYDRTFGVEVVNKGSNAVYGRHYTLESQSVTIPAGKRATKVYVKGIYDNIENTDSLGFTLRLVSLDDVEWDLYGLETKVRMQKSCPFDIHAFTGYCLVTSSFLSQYAATSGATRLATSEIVANKENTIRIRGLYYDGIDVEFRLDPADPLNPKFRLAGKQQVADTREAFSYIYGNGRILAEDAQGAPNFFNSCQNFAVQYVSLTIDGMSDEELEKMGTNRIGTFVHIIEWITDEEAEEYK